MNRGHIQIHTGQIFLMRCHNIFQLRSWRPTHSDRVVFVPQQNQTVSTESSTYLWVCTEVYFQHLFCVWVNDWVNDCTHLMPHDLLYNWKDILFSRLHRFRSWCALEEKYLHSVSSLTFCHSTNKMQKYCRTSTVLVNFIPFVQISRKPPSEPPALLLYLKYFPAADRFSLGVLIYWRQTSPLWEAPGCYNTSISILAVPFSLTCVQLKAEQTFFQQLWFLVLLISLNRVCACSQCRTRQRACCRTELKRKLHYLIMEVTFSASARQFWTQR